MKKTIAALIVVVMLFMVGIPNQKAEADVITISALSAAAYAIAQQAGLDFAFTSGTAIGSQSFMENRLTSWINSNGGISIFGLTPVRALAAKLAITQTAFLKLKEFINDFITEEIITDTPTIVSDGAMNGYAVGQYRENFDIETSGLSLHSTTYTFPEWTPYNSINIQFYRNGSYANVSMSVDRQSGYTQMMLKSWALILNPNGTDSNNKYAVSVKYACKTSGGAEQEFTATKVIYQSNFPIDTYLTNQITATVPQSGLDYPDVGLNDLQTYKRQDWGADTNFEDMVGDIFTDVAGNDLILEPDTVEEQPQVTPVPTAAPGVDTNIGEIVGGIYESVGEIAGTLEGVQEGVGEITEALEGVGSDVASISEALEIPTTSEATNLKLPDLRTLFPFCIPFDIYNIITAFNASPVAPRVQIPFNIPAIGLTYTFDLDFATYNSVAAVLRTVEFVAYAIGLAILTSKVIRW